MILARENESNKFDAWAKEIERRDDLIEEVDVYARVEKQGTGKGNCDTTARSLIWHTLQGHGKIERFRMWKLASDEAQKQVKSSDMCDRERLERTAWSVLEIMFVVTKSSYTEE